MQVIDTPKHRRIDFCTFSEFLAYAEDQVPPHLRSRYHSRGLHSWRSDCDEHFYHTKSFDEAKSLLRNGWDEGTQRLADLRSSLTDILDRAIGVKRCSGVGYDVAAGEWLDVGRYLSGEPECFGITTEGTELSQKIVKVRLNLSASGACTSDEFFSRGAIAIGLIDALESLGHRVEFQIGTCSTSTSDDDEGRIYEFVAVAKEAEQPLDVDRLAFLCCHPAALRRYTFSVYEKQGRKKSGSPRKFTDQETGDFITIGQILHGGHLTPEQYAEQVLKLCRLAGVEFDEDLLSR
jgi:hypothetical protein